MDIGRWHVDLFRAAALIAVLVMISIQFDVLLALALFGLLIVFWAVSLWPRAFHDNAFFIAIVVYFLAFFIVGQAHARIEFYEAAAQIIPVLFVAMAVGSRLLSLSGREEVERRVRIVLIYAFAVGEWYSLDALASGEPGQSAFSFVVAALAAAAAVVIAEVVGRER